MSLSTPSTKTQILEVASHLFLERGYNSFSFQHIADQVGIRKASIHSHFKDKEELGVKIIDQYIHDFELWTKKRTQRTGPEQIKSFIKLIQNHYLHQDSLCANGALFSDWSLLPNKVKARAQVLQYQQLQWLTRCLSHLGEAAPHRAEILFVSLIGAVQAARAWNNNKFFESCATTLLRDVGIELE